MRTAAFILSILSVPCAEAQPIGRAYFYVAEGSKRCFQENTPKSLPVTVSYQAYDIPGVTCSISMLDPQGRVVSNREVTGDDPQGKLIYVTQSSGQHSVCVNCATAKWFGTAMIKWTISVDLGDAEINFQAAAKGKSVETHEQLIRAVTAQIGILIKENYYKRTQENELHVSTSNLGSGIIKCALLQMAVIGVSTVVAAVHLTRHFRYEKLVG